MRSRASLVPSSVRKVCQLTGERDRERGTLAFNQTETNFGFFGTDLGSSFEHGGRLWFLFGDTWPGPGPSPLAAVTRLDGALDAFWIGPDGAVATTWANPQLDSGQWHPPFPITPPGAACHGSSIAAVTRLEGALDVFWIGPDGAVGTTWANPRVDAARWHPPFPITPPGATRAASPLVAVTRFEGALDRAGWRGRYHMG
jgi:hypothetical protein